MNGKNEKLAKQSEAIMGRIFYFESRDKLLNALNRQLEEDIRSGLIESTISATKLAREQIEKFLKGEDISNNVLTCLCTYYFGYRNRYVLEPMHNVHQTKSPSLVN